MAELMDQGPTARVGPKSQDDVGVVDLEELIALSRQPSNVILEGFTLLLLTTLQILGVARPHVRVLKVTDEDLLEILLGINQVSGQVVKTGPGRVNQVDGDKLDDEEVIIRHACPACKTVVLQPNVGVDFAIIHYDVIRRLKMFWEAHVMHVAPKHFGPCPVGAEATYLSIVAAVETWVVHMVLKMHSLVPPVSLTACQRLEASTRMAWLEAGQDLCW
jgi:hypothetical protein